MSQTERNALFVVVHVYESKSPLFNTKKNASVRAVQRCDAVARKVVEVPPRFYPFRVTAHVAFPLNGVPERDLIVADACKTLAEPQFVAPAPEPFVVAALVSAFGRRPPRASRRVLTYWGCKRRSVSGAQSEANSETYRFARDKRRR